MLEKTKAIVIHSTRYGDSSLIVQCFTEKWGRQSYLMKGVRKAKKNNRSNQFQPLFLIHLDIYFKPNRDLQWIKEVNMIHPMNSLQGNIIKKAQALFMAEVLAKTLHEEEHNESLFNFLETSVTYFETLESQYSSFHLFFLFQLTKHLGFGPDNNYSEEQIYFDLESGSFTNLPAAGEKEIQRRLGKFWKVCFTSSYEKFDQEVSNQNDRNAFLDSILHFYKIHMPNLRDFNSIEILRTVFSN